VGFEPNPHHTFVLNDIEKHYADCGWRAYFFTETAASHDDGNITFITDNDTNNKEWGGSIVANERKTVRRKKSTHFLDIIVSFCIEGQFCGSSQENAALRLHPQDCHEEEFHFHI